MRKLSSFEIKLVAVVTMVIDHIGAVFFPQNTLLRVIGRISFPLFCFMAVLGFIYTRNIYRYLGRLLICAIVSEIFFDFAFHGGIYFDANNSVFTLAAGVASLHVMKKQGYLTGCVFTLVSGFFLNVCHFDYGLYGTILIVLIYFAYRFCMETKKSMYLSWGVVALFMIFYRPDIQAFAAFAIIFMALYDGQKGYERKWIKNFFYIFYPAHLLILAIIRLALN